MYAIRSYYAFPAYEQRLQLWQNALPKAFEYEESLLENLAKNYQLTGASIYNSYNFV